jgi:hypothetical protein
VQPIGGKLDVVVHDGHDLGRNLLDTSVHGTGEAEILRQAVDDSAEAFSDVSRLVSRAVVHHDDVIEGASLSGHCRQKGTEEGDAIPVRDYR